VQNISPLQAAPCFLLWDKRPHSFGPAANFIGFKAQNCCCLAAIYVVVGCNCSGTI